MQINRYIIDTIRTGSSNQIQKVVTLSMFVLSFHKQEVLLQTSKVEIEFLMLFGLAFQNCFYPPKEIFLEATIPSFWLF